MTMARRERRDDFLDVLGGIARTAFSETKMQRRRRHRTFMKWLKVAIALVVSTIVIPIALATAGFFLGPKGTEGLILAPLAVISAWAIILFVALRKKRAPIALPKGEIAALPAHTSEWLDFQREGLPWAAQQKLDSITTKLEQLTPQLRRLDPQAPGAVEARRLLAVELPELVHGYQKLPPSLQQKPLHGGPTPEHRLIDGLATIDDEIGRLHDRLAADDLHALATQQRYLELKYKEKDKL
jgi:hypothetical protein